MRLPVGTRVRALNEIWDEDDNGQEYLHATPGTVGVIHAYQRGDGDDIPTINWNALGQGRGFYDCPIAGVSMGPVYDDLPPDEDYDTVEVVGMEPWNVAPQGSQDN